MAKFLVWSAVLLLIGLPYFIHVGTNPGFALLWLLVTVVVLSKKKPEDSIRTQVEIYVSSLAGRKWVTIVGLSYLIALCWFIFIYFIYGICSFGDDRFFGVRLCSGSDADHQIWRIFYAPWVITIFIVALLFRAPDTVKVFAMDIAKSWLSRK